uniref:Putative ixostatin n=1 Tax=Ixodes ricinus TaxID=34613 RepID=A0A0K8R4W4_IXORI
MMPTGVLLVFAALAVICIPVETSSSNDCNKVTPESFEKLKNGTRPHRPAYGLGLLCERTHPKGDSSVTCIGHAVQGSPLCTFCCACMHNNGTLDNNRRNLPSRYPCKSKGPQKQ